MRELGPTLAQQPRLGYLLVDREQLISDIAKAMALSKFEICGLVNSISMEPSYHHVFRCAGPIDALNFGYLSLARVPWLWLTRGQAGDVVPRNVHLAAGGAHGVTHAKQASWNRGALRKATGNHHVASFVRWSCRTHDDAPKTTGKQRVFLHLIRPTITGD